jgi:hypothetical protein
MAAVAYLGGERTFLFLEFGNQLVAPFLGRGEFATQLLRGLLVVIVVVVAEPNVGKDD